VWQHLVVVVGYMAADMAKTRPKRRGRGEVADAKIAEMDMFSSTEAEIVMHGK
jgi:hypothetical protein